MTSAPNAPFDVSKYTGSSLVDVFGKAENFYKEGMSHLRESLNIYELCSQQDIPLHEKGVLHQKIWELEKKFGHHSLYFSQSGQDRFIHKSYFEDKRCGTFIELGAYNGWHGSNCLFFEKILGWNGLIVEASPSLARSVAAVRNSQVIHAAISDHEGTSKFMDVTSGYKQMGGMLDYYNAHILGIVRRDPEHLEQIIEIPAIRLTTLLRKNNLREIDYCSIDIEGAERAALTSFDFDEFDVSIFSIENQTGKASGSYGDIMKPAGYELVAVLGADEIWVKQSFIASHR